MYYEGAWFVGELVHRYGVAQFLSLYGRLDYRFSRDQITAAFQAVYGETLDAVWSAALRSNTQVRCINLWQCSGAVLTPDGSLQTLAQACDGSDTTRTFELGVDTDAVISSTSYYIHAPLSCNEEFPSPIGGGSLDDFYFPAILRIPSNKYFIGGHGLAAADVGLRALPASAYSRDCTEIQAVDLGSAEFTPDDLELAFPNDGDFWFIKLRPTSERPLWAGVPGIVEECPTCQDLSTCRSFDAASHPDAEGNVTLRFKSASPGLGYVTYYVLH